MLCSDAIAVVLDLFKDPKKADDQIRAVQHDARKHDADERDLVVADLLRRRGLVRGYLCRALDAVPPEGCALRDTPQRGREVVVEAERERRGPHRDEEHFRDCVQELCRGRPEAERFSKIFKLGKTRFVIGTRYEEMKIRAYINRGHHMDECWRGEYDG